MNFNSIEFLVFCPVVILGFWAFPHKLRKYWLLTASYLFYMYWNPILILLLLASTAVDYFCGLGIEKYRQNQPLAKLFLILSICANLGMLFTFKYADFFGDTVNQLCALVSIPYRVPPMNLILPVGISFYTFQTMSYTIDVYRGDFTAEKDPVSFALFVTYFPQLVAGPIERPQDLMPQLKKEQKFCWEDLTAGARLMVSGFFRKCVVADACGIFVNAVYSNIEGSNALALILGAFFFALQIYCDFSGYSEIANGTARMMGVRLTRNFNYPWLSVSYTEFFRRWHITLNRWFTQYLYIPLGGSRKGPVRKMLNHFIVFALSGLWHGANWTYVLWGLHAALVLSFESVTLKPVERFLENRGVDLSNPFLVLIRRFLVICHFIIAAVFFRCNNFQEIGQFFIGMVTRLGFGHGYLRDTVAAIGFTPLNVAQLLLGCAILARLRSWEVFDMAPAKTGTLSAHRWSTLVLGILVVALCWISMLATQDAAAFAYFQF